MENEIISLLTLYGMAYSLEWRGIGVRAHESRFWVPQSVPTSRKDRFHVWNPLSDTIY